MIEVSLTGSHGEDFPGVKVDGAETESVYRAAVVFTPDGVGLEIEMHLDRAVQLGENSADMKLLVRQDTGTALVSVNGCQAFHANLCVSGNVL